MSLPTDPDARKGIPIYSGLVKYFPHAIAAVAQLSKVGNDQHNPGLPLHWAKEKSSDEADALSRHLIDMAVDETHRDPDGVLAAVKMGWRALANLERMHDRGINIFLEEESTDGYEAGDWCYRGVNVAFSTGGVQGITRGDAESSDSAGCCRADASGPA